LSITLSDFTQIEVKKQERIDAIDRAIEKICKEELPAVQKNDITKTEIVQRMAKYLEEKYTLQGLPSYINTISVEITRKFKENGITNYHHVPDLLPDKYKDPQQAANAKQRAEQIESELDPLHPKSLLLGTNVGNNVPEQMNDTELEEFVRAEQKRVKKLVDLATSRGIILVSIPSEEGWHNEGKVWPKIRTVDPPTTDEEVTTLVRELQKENDKTMDAFYEELIRFWCQNKEQVPNWINGIRAFFTIFKWLNDDKYSLDPFSWMDRFSYLESHGKHAAAVWSKAITVFCAKCSELLDEDESEYEVMISDPDSNTNWRCPKCQGTKTVLRSMTREQIGDRKDFIVNFAEYILGTIPGFMQMMKWYREWKQPYNTARKSRLASELREKA
jgi:hypothetical protein